LFLELYEEKFIDNIFMTNEALITREDFKTAVAGDMDEDAKCSWLFSPTRVREVFSSSKMLEEMIQHEILIE